LVRAAGFAADGRAPAQLRRSTGGPTVQRKSHFLPGSHFQAIGLLLLGK
jgi:hypothetical protein